METLQHDVLIVGGGGAGLRAAIAVARDHPSTSVGVISKVYPMRSHTVSAEGGAAAVIAPGDSLDDHAYDTISGSDWLADQDAVELLVENGPNEMLQLEHWGCPWSREPDGSIAVRPFGGMKLERTWFAADKTGFHLLHTLFQTSLKYAAITRYDEWFVTSLIVDHGRCQGVTAIEIRTGEMFAIGARSVIMCTGGAGRVYPFTTNGNIKTGDGMALAYRAGVPLKDMEFVQYHPTGLPGTGILITEAARGEGGILVNNEGRRYLQDYDLGQPLDIDDPNHPQKRTMELGPRDRLSQAFIHERTAGRTFQDPDGDYVHLDIRHLGERKIDRKIPMVRELAVRYVGIDPVSEPIPVRTVVHYMMGGIDTDIKGATSLPGLFAAGECACVSVNGANRLGSNSLTEILVFGARAAVAAVDHAGQVSPPSNQLLESSARAEEDRLEETLLRSNGGGETVSAIRADLQQNLEEGAGIFRDQQTLERTTAVIADLKRRYKKLVLSDRSRTFNTELIAALELGAMIEVGEAIAHSALARTESRGSHQRTDHPQRDDDRFLKHSLAYRGEGDPSIGYKDVTITRWQPGERVYGDV
ncbi:MAG TPA: fumarate reductase (quinol) flavoprotein subunit [Acidimicrobiia bacterium]|nr:fumarate reductase (quinol) flavoprotein subunit [Acidimicrobiia bacterium]